MAFQLQWTYTAQGLSPVPTNFALDTPIYPTPASLPFDPLLATSMLSASSPIATQAVTTPAPQTSTIYETVTVTLVQTTTVGDVPNLLSNIAPSSTPAAVSSATQGATLPPTPSASPLGEQPLLPLPISLSLPIPVQPVLPSLPLDLPLPPVLQLPTSTSSSLPSTSALPKPQREWSAPSSIEDLSSFGIIKFYGNVHNVDLVEGIPASASALPHPSSAPFDPNAPSYLQHPSSSSGTAGDDSGDGDDDDTTTTPALPTPWDSSWTNTTKVLQILYPAHSANPSSKPTGGAQFYANPFLHTASSPSSSSSPFTSTTAEGGIEIAKNVSFEYSVFFPRDFDWVKGGKLPGLYGGHEGCSGGDSAESCWSTRMMWRAGGEGELYLYAPRDKQPAYLCADPTSVCNAVYGFSVGRGSFSFVSGGWTKLRQTIVLNTPGKQDGVFVLDINGKRVLERDGLFYRETGRKGSSGRDGDDDERNGTGAGKGGGGGKGKGGKKGGKGSSSSGGGLLGGLLWSPQSLLQREDQRPVNLQVPAQDDAVRSDLAAQFQKILGPSRSVYLAGVAPGSVEEDMLHGAQGVLRPDVIEYSEVDPQDNEGEGYDERQLPILTLGSIKLSAENNLEAFSPIEGDIAFEKPSATIQDQAAATEKPIGFTGIFFSTFFGGHQPEYATPRDHLHPSLLLIFSDQTGNIARYFTRLVVAVAASFIKTPQYTLSRVTDSFSAFWTEIRGLTSIRTLQVECLDKLTAEGVPFFNKIYGHAVFTTLEATGGILHSLRLQVTSSRGAVAVDAVPDSISSLRPNTLKEFQLNYECRTESDHDRCPACTVVCSQISNLVINQSNLDRLELDHSCRKTPVTVHHIFPSTIKDCNLRTLRLYNKADSESGVGVSEPGSLRLPTLHKLRHLTLRGHHDSETVFWKAMKNRILNLKSLDMTFRDSAVLCLSSLPGIPVLRVRRESGAGFSPLWRLSFSQEVLAKHAPTLRELSLHWYSARGEPGPWGRISAGYIRRNWPQLSSFIHLERIALKAFGSKLEVAEIEWTQVVVFDTRELSEYRRVTDATLLEALKQRKICDSQALRSKTGLPRKLILVYYLFTHPNPSVLVTEELYAIKLEGEHRKGNLDSGARIWGYERISRTLGRCGEDVFVIM
ncbi:hypothetical protein AX16_008970 [Volvariella volvacea WC 439]|nr:hypothetical protein AX16_008970 [Volvariella volvacea WC 439]